MMYSLTDIKFSSGPSIFSKCTQYCFVLTFDNGDENNTWTVKFYFYSGVSLPKFLSMLMELAKEIADLVYQESK